MNNDFINSILNRCINNYQDHIDNYKELKSNSNIDIKDIYRRIGLNFFHTCIGKGLRPNQIPGIGEVLPYNKFVSSI